MLDDLPSIASLRALVAVASLALGASKVEFANLVTDRLEADPAATDSALRFAAMYRRALDY